MIVSRGEGFLAWSQYNYPKKDDIKLSTSLAQKESSYMSRKINIFLVLIIAYSSSSKTLQASPTGTFSLDQKYLTNFSLAPWNRLHD